MKLPEYTIVSPPSTGNYFSGHTDASLLAWGTKVRAEALEDAAQACMQIAMAPSNTILGVAVTCAEHIRKLK